METVGPRIQPRGQDHRLPYAGAGCPEEVFVEELGAHGHPADHRRCAFATRVSERGGVQAAVEHVYEERDTDRANQWLGERVVD